MSVSNLTNTIWVINNIPNIGESNVDYYINFISFNQNYTTLSLKPTVSPAVMRGIHYNNITAFYSFDGNYWQNEIYRIIEITGGTDVTNATLIAWLEANATQVEVMDLTNTKWVINSVTCSAGYGLFEINFDVNVEGYGNETKLGIGYSILPPASYTPTANFISSYSSFYDIGINDYIYISSGTDIANPDLIAWLAQNATYEEPTPVISSGINIGSNLVSKIYIGSAQVQRVYIGSSLIYGEEAPGPSGGTVTITIQDQYSTGSKYGFYVYDGQDDTGTLLFSDFDRYPTGSVTTTVNCTSGYLYIYMNGGIVVFNGSATGDISPTTFGGFDEDNVTFTVDGDGAITFSDIDWDD